MESKTKTNLSLEIIETLIKKHFPEAGNLHITELKDGMQNNAFVVSGSGIPKEKMVLKVGPSEHADILTYEHRTISTEVWMYKMLENLAVPIPKLYASDFSHKEIASDYFFIEFIDGITWSKCQKRISEENRPKLMQELGQYNAVINSVQGEKFGYINRDGKAGHESWSEAFHSMIEDILEDGRKRGCTLPYEQIMKCIEDNKELLDEVLTPRLVDYDLWAGNIFINPDGYREISAVFDFGHAFFGDPCAGFTSAVHLFQDVEQEPFFCRGYSEVSGTSLVITDSDRKRMDFYRLYMQIILYVEAYRYPDEVCSRQRESAMRRINNLLEKISYLV